MSLSVTDLAAVRHSPTALFLTELFLIITVRLLTVARSHRRVPVIATWCITVRVLDTVNAQMCNWHHVLQELIRRWDSERELLRSAPRSYQNSLK